MLLLTSGSPETMMLSTFAILASTRRLQAPRMTFLRRPLSFHLSRRSSVAAERTHYRSTSVAHLEDHSLYFDYVSDDAVDVDDGPERIVETGDVGGACEW